MSLPRITITLADTATATGWAVTVRHGDAEVCSPFVMVAGPDGLPPAHFDLGPLLERLTRALGQDGDVPRYGRWLFDSLLASAWPQIVALPEVVAARGVELALQLPAGAYDLQRLVWEAMYDGDQSLAGHHDLLVAITRLVDVALDPPEPITRLPRVLFAVGSRLNDAVVRPGAMFMGLLRMLDARGLCLTRTTGQVSVTDLATECRAFAPDLVHLVAHGESGRLELNGESVTGDQLLTALASGGKPVAVVLSACHSAAAQADAGPLAAELVAGGIPIVTAMTGEISEPACRLYTRNFAMAVHAGEPVVEAVAHGRRAALLRSPAATASLDWAMPSLLLATSVEPGFRLVDPAAARRVTALARSLELIQMPVFVGRGEIVALADELFHPDRGSGFVAVVRHGVVPRQDGTPFRLGSMRLLRELAFRLLRSGHVPLLLGPWPEGGAPATLRKMIFEIAQQVLEVAETFGVAPGRVHVLDAGLALSPDADRARDQVNEALWAFHDDPGPLAAGQVRAKLAGDLAAFATVIGATGEPFGPHTRVVVLAHAVHTWADALDDLLKMSRSSGLGTAEQPVPLIVTASLHDGNGRAVGSFRDRKSGTPGYAFPELAPLADDEAMLGFQWVLLHPWKGPLGSDKIYVPARKAPPERVHEQLRLLEGEPGAVRDMLYFLARSNSPASGGGLLERDDDEAAYAGYLDFLRGPR